MIGGYIKNIHRQELSIVNHKATSRHNIFHKQEEIRGHVNHAIVNGHIQTVVTYSKIEFSLDKYKYP